jgi:outer membrane protein
MNRQPLTIQRQHLGALFIFSLIAVSTLAPRAVRADDASPRLALDAPFPVPGNVQIAIFQSLENRRPGPPVFTTNLPPALAAQGIALPGLSDGTFTVRAFADANGDGRMNANVFGVPTEPALRQPMTWPPTDGTEVRLTLAPAPADPRAWGVGVFALFGSNPYRGGERVARVLPYLSYVGESLYVIGPRAGYNLFKNRTISVNLAASYEFSGEAFDDSRFLEGMDNRRDTLMAGLDASMRLIGPWSLDADALTDTLGRHDGQKLALTLKRSFRGNRWGLTPELGLVWNSGTYNDYYYGVRAREATDARPAYKPSDSFEPYAGILFRTEITSNWIALASLRWELLSDEVQDSPIIDKQGVYSTFIGLSYIF